MSVGSAFDAFVKAALALDVWGPGSVPEYLVFDTLFESQVDASLREWAAEAGGHCYRVYCDSGAYAAVRDELTGATSEPMFEATLKGEINGVPLLGKPDLIFKDARNNLRILDWKVNGYCSKKGHKAKRGYSRIFGDGDEVPHPKCELGRHKGVLLNLAEPFEKIEKSWAGQTATYAWLKNGEVGGDFICQIDQLFCSPSTAGFPVVRVAEHKGLVSDDFQANLLERYINLWEIINSGHIFRSSPRDESHARQEILDVKHAEYTHLESEKYLEGLM
jgi:hypothetical protein